MRLILSTAISLVCAIASTTVIADNRNSIRKQYEDRHLLVRASTSKPEQLEAFYIGRGFPQNAVNEIKKTCFVTTMVKNKAYKALWLILDDWVFIDSTGKKIKRIRRSNWKSTWKSMDLKQAYQSTFGWTQLPESRDLRVDEHAAGNVTIPWQEKPFSMIATFRTGLDKSGTPRTVTLENLQCRK